MTTQRWNPERFVVRKNEKTIWNYASPYAFWEYEFVQGRDSFMKIRKSLIINKMKPRNEKVYVFLQHLKKKSLHLFKK